MFFTTTPDWMLLSGYFLQMRGPCTLTFIPSFGFQRYSNNFSKGQFFKIYYMLFNFQDVEQ